MPPLIVLRLHPVEPVDGDAFQAYLEDLSIEVFDLGINNLPGGASLGTAAFVAPDPADPLTPDPTTAIVQHVGQLEDAPPGVVGLLAVATAVIEVQATAGPEHETRDLRLEITRGTGSFVHRQLYFNVPVSTDPLPGDRGDWPDLDPTSLYLALGDPTRDIDPNDAHVELPADGSPPQYDDLKTAVDIVLGHDPGAGNPPSLAELTVKQARHVAYEIVWNQKFRPLPIPSKRTLEQMYTLPEKTGDDGDEAARGRFEGDLKAYYSTGDADAERLAGFVYALAAAVAAEHTTAAATRVGFLMPVLPQATGTGARFKSVRVILTGRSPADPAAVPEQLVTPFTVPAAYFYALGATMPVQADPEQRYRLATLQEEENLRSQLQASVELGAIVLDNNGDIDGVNIAQAARRLRSLGAVRGVAPAFAVNGVAADGVANPQGRAAVRELLAGPGWLDVKGEDIFGFWEGALTATQLRGHFELVLRALTDSHEALIAAIKAIPAVKADDIDDRSADQWRALFGQPVVDEMLLPAFTQPGSPTERVAAFIRHVQKFFTVDTTIEPPGDRGIGGPAHLRALTDDPLRAFADSYRTITGTDFQFGAGLANVGGAVEAVFPQADDPDAHAWLLQVIGTVEELLELVTVPAIPDELRVAAMEALYARGFTSRAQVTALSLERFREALVGTVAYEHAADIHQAAGPVVPPGDGGFSPVNPDGCLVDCVPPPHLSPFGPVAYLNELLGLTASWTCAGAPVGDESPTLGTLLGTRRGPLGDLLVTRANLQTPLPLVDLANECLEAVAAHPANPAGVVHQTSGTTLGGHALDHHDPATMFAALPEHSTPATPVAEPGAHASLRADFSAPELPYAQALDVDRTYLGHLGGTRYDVMRRFRVDITELVLDPAREPAGFQRHLWRYPVRIDIAREYLGISPEEYDLLFTHDTVDVPTPQRLLMRELYGFDADVVGGRPWTEVVAGLPEFLARTGLGWCDFLALWRSEFVRFDRAGDERGFDDCEPCHLDQYRIRFLDPADAVTALRRLAVFVRLWRTLRKLPGGGYTFTELRDICDVLGLFTAGAITPDFVRQLAAFQILRDDFAVALTDGTPAPAGATGADRTHLLALWVGPTAAAWDWAVDELLDQVQRYAQTRHRCRPRPPQFVKLLAANLDPLSGLAGFDPRQAADTWHARPTHTLRLAEVLAKLYASDFGIGEVLYLFTAGDHLGGDDPFPLQPDNEAVESPLGLPDDERTFSLWDLRTKLLSVHVADEDAAAWSWARIDTTLRVRFGYAPPTGGPDPLLSLGQHYFPSVLETAGTPVPAVQRQYRVNLAGTAPLLWNTPGGPFDYDTANQQLFTELPLTDEDVIAKLSRIRQLNPAERAAVRELYFLPRADLAPFALLFANFAETEERLIQEPDEARRWAWFQRQFALFSARATVIAEHLAGHVAEWTGRDGAGGAELAWRVLQHLFGDENRARTSWEDDTGQPPAVTWPDQPTGGAFAALLGLTGTGLLGELTPEAGALAWRELRGPMDAFGAEENAGNAPVPTVLPAMDLTLTSAQERFASARNGFTIANPDGAPLGGAQGFTVRWHGMLLVDEDGSYTFRAGGPTPEGEAPDFEAAEDKRWRVLLERGQRTWVLLSHHWPDETVPGRRPATLALRRGTYELTVELAQPQPAYDSPDDVHPVIGGFQVKYAGPDTCGRLVAIPHERLFQISKDQTLAFKLGELDSAAGRFLSSRYSSSLRDIRRTYQRAFKALLFAHRFGLSAQRVADDQQSEIGYMLAHADDFAGTSYYRSGGAFAVHRAFFDFNLLPLRDNFFPPRPAQDARMRPSDRRRHALFDWWERVFDYTIVRRDAQTAAEQPLWLLFHEAAENHPDDPAHLVRHMGVDLLHDRLVLRYHPGFAVASADLEDDRWVVRVWHAETWVRALDRRFFVRDIREARPDLWASDDPGVVLPGETESGNANLTRFVRDGCIENGGPRRYEDIERLNDALRLRGRRALLAYLCGMNRVPLPAGGGATAPKQLSEVLLLDVEAALCERTSRIEEAISAVQAFVQRARLGLEPSLAVTPAFALLWDRRFATYRVWEACKRRSVYQENWVEWDELDQARGTEGFRFLEAELRRAALTSPVPGGVEYWPDQRPPDHRGLTVLQAREPAHIQRVDPQHHGFDLLGSPERHARPSWLAALGLPQGGVDEGDTNDDATNDNDVGPIVTVLAAELDGDTTHLPLWIQAAIRLGARFIRVAAAGEPLASTTFVPRDPEDEPLVCCDECGTTHPAVVDEYYFWLLDSSAFEPETQQADDGHGGVDPGGGGGGIEEAQAPASWSWHDPAMLPRLLQWAPEPVVHLAWCRVHNGEFKQERRSFEGIAVTAPGPELVFTGRTEDSLRFEVTGAKPPLGHDDPTPPGFRYDLATDVAVPVPLVLAPPGETTLTAAVAAADTSISVDSTGGFPTSFPYTLVVDYESTTAERVSVTAAAGTTLTVTRGALRTTPVAHANGARVAYLGTYPGQLPAYPYFAYYAPGAPVVPPSPFAPAVAVAASLRANCQFEAALKWYELAFAPLRSDSTWLVCQDEDGGEGPEDPDGPGIPEGPGLVAAEGAEVCCHDSTVTTAADARRRSIVLHYLETLLEWGDALLRRNSPEAFQQARLVYDTMARLLGPAPRTVLPADPAGAPDKVSGFAAHHSPLNPRLGVLYGHSADRLALIHACLNAGRLRIGQPPFGGERAVLEGWQASAEPCLDDADWCLPPCPYRFTYLVQKAQELAGEVSSLGAALLSAYEKGDAEYLASLRATHERQLLNLTLEVRQNQWRESDWQVQALQKTREIAQTRLRHYTLLIQNGLNNREDEHAALIDTSVGERVAGNVSEGIAQVMNAIPDIFAGFPVTQTWLPLGTKLSGLFMAVARIANVLAEIASSTGGLRLTQAGWERREEEWRHQVELLDIELEQIERQILAAERRRDIALRELNNYQRQIEQSAEVHDFLRDKFTSHELYLFLQQETAALHARAYELALHSARQAQRAFNYERGHTARTFVTGELWDSLREGLLAGERLQLALRQMEHAYLGANAREYELTKQISLNRHFPMELLCLLANGVCEIDLPEWMFDLDYPGQYLRRIKNVSLTIPCVVGPYVGVNCRLTLLSSSTRVDPDLVDPPHACCPDGRPGHGYEAQPDDRRIVRQYTATEAIATSNGQNDTGMFELNFRDERYLPFEFAGAVSRWRIELPPDNNHFDLGTVTDVVLHLNYTAREGGENLRRVANEVAQGYLLGSGVRLFDVEHDMPDAWQPMRAHAGGNGHRARELALRLGRGMFPYVPGRHELLVGQVELFFEAPGAEPSAHQTVRFARAPRHGHGPADADEPEARELHCVASADWPGLYHGVLEGVDFGPLGHGGDRELGVFRFPARLGRVSRAFLVCRYAVRELAETDHRDRHVVDLAAHGLGELAAAAAPGREMELAPGREMETLTR